MKNYGAPILVLALVVAVLLAGGIHQSSVSAQTAKATYSVARWGLRPAASSCCYVPIVELCPGSKPIDVTEVRVSGDVFAGTEGDTQLILARSAPLPGVDFYKNISPLDPSSPPAQTTALRLVNQTVPDGQPLMPAGWAIIKAQALPLNSAPYTLYHWNGINTPLTVNPGQCLFLVGNDQSPNLNYLLFDAEFAE